MDPQERDELGNAQTIRASLWPKKHGAPKAVAGVGSLGVASAVIYYLLSTAAAQEDRLDRVERKTASCHRVVEDMRDLKRDVRQVRETVMWMKGQMDK